MIKSIPVLLFLWGISALAVSGQSVLDRELSIAFVQTDLPRALQQLQREADLQLLYSDHIVPDKSINVSLHKYTLRSVLDYLFQDTRLTYELNGSRILLTRRARHTEDGTSSGTKYTVSGYVEDSESGERLIGATVQLIGVDLGTYTNEYGFFSLHLPAGVQHVQVSYLGCRPWRIHLPIRQDTLLRVALQRELVLQEVEVIAVDSTVERAPQDYTAHHLQLDQARAMPKLAGETDLIRSIQLLPGVQTGADGVGGIYVRGANPGQNLVLIDGVPLYNMNHAGGLLSIINEEVVKQVKLLKGGFPARYAGRLSSVLDIRTRDGNRKQLAGHLELSPLAVKASLEGPVIKDHSSFLVSGRRSILNWYLGPQSRDFKRESLDEDGSIDYAFGDLNLKWSSDLSSTNKLYASLYFGSDRFSNTGAIDRDFKLRHDGQGWHIRQASEYKEQLQWNNQALSLRWNAVLAPSLFLNTTLTYSKLAAQADYEQRDTFSLEQPVRSSVDRLNVARFQTSIEDLGLRMDFDWRPHPDHYYRFGLRMTGNTFRPGALQYDEAYREEINSGDFSNPDRQTSELAVYAEDDYDVNTRLSINYGAHLAIFHTDNRTYTSLQPRIAAHYQSSERLAFTASISRSMQFHHLLSSGTIDFPTDLWVPSTRRIAPQQAWQGTTGAIYALGNGFQLQAEAYYKHMDNLLSYNEGAFFLNDWEDNITAGTGLAYGLDIYLEKQYGSTRGWISYSLARTERTYERINFNRPYPYKYDRRHDLKAAVVQNLTPRLELSANWLFGTGLAFTLPQSGYSINFPEGPDIPVQATNFGEKNSFRLPNYQRLDLAVNYRLSSKEAKWQHQVQIGAYNVLNTRNPLYYRFDREIEVMQGQLVENRTFKEVPLLPRLWSLNYSVRF